MNTEVLGFTDAVAADWLTNDRNLPVPDGVDLCVDVLISALHSCEGHRSEPVGMARAARSANPAGRGD